MKRWPDELTVAPIRAAQGVVRLPGSKSLSNRALLLSALAEGSTELVGLLDADDTRVMIAALRALGVRLEVGAREGQAVTQVSGCAGRWPARSADLHLGNAGTAMRSLTAALAFAGGQYRLDGVPRMRERPIGDLVDALNALGADVRYEANAGYPPLLIGAGAFGGRSHVEVRGEVSSQFVSGLLMAAPLIGSNGTSGTNGLTVEVPGTLISQPYVSMTVELMRRFGVPVTRVSGTTRFVVPRANYRSPGRFDVEGDASGASYFLALGAIAGGPVRVNGAGRRSVQGDIAFADLLEKMGARVAWGDDWIEARGGARLKGGTFDCDAIPDAAMTAAIVGLFATGRTVLRGIGSWRVKETDRIAAMATELAKVGARVDSGADWIAVEPPATWREAAIDTYDDHRMAMCFSLAACGGVPVRIRDPGCVEKTYPDYFDELDRLTGR